MKTLIPAIVTPSYLARVELLAERLRRRIERGELRGHRAEDFHGLGLTASRGRLAPPQFRLEAACRRSICPSFAEAHLVLAVSQFAPYLDSALMLEDARRAAAECAAFDVLRIARERGWYVPARGEYTRPHAIFTEDEEEAIGQRPRNSAVDAWATLLPWLTAKPGFTA